MWTFHFALNATFSIGFWNGFCTIALYIGCTYVWDMYVHVFARWVAWGFQMWVRKPLDFLKVRIGMYWYIPVCTIAEFLYWPVPSCTGTYWYVPVRTILPNPVQGYRIPNAHVRTMYVHWHGSLLGHRDVCTGFGPIVTARAPGPGSGRISGRVRLMFWNRSKHSSAWAGCLPAPVQILTHQPHRSPFSRRVTWKSDCSHFQEASHKLVSCTTRLYYKICWVSRWWAGARCAAWRHTFIWNLGSCDITVLVMIS